MSQSDKATDFAKLHVKGSPLVLYNAWDAGTAKAVAAAGAKAIATSSWAVAEAHGYRDGETIPNQLVEAIAGRIAKAVALPVSVDFEGGYSDDDGVLAENVGRLMDLGVVGINFEDRVVKGQGLYSADRQARRIAAIRGTAEKRSVAFFINARTDLFLGRGGEHADEVKEAVVRAKAYESAGASGFFVPGLVDPVLIGQVVDGTSLPVNVMIWDGLPEAARLAELGVARISYGAASYSQAIADLTRRAAAALS